MRKKKKKSLASGLRFISATKSACLHFSLHCWMLVHLGMRSYLKGDTTGKGDLEGIQNMSLSCYRESLFKKPPEQQIKDVDMNLRQWSSGQAFLFWATGFCPSHSETHQTGSWFNGSVKCMSNGMRKVWRTHGVGCEGSKVWLTISQHPPCKGPRAGIKLNVGTETNFSLFQGWIKFIIAKFLCDYVFSSMGPMGSIQAVCFPTSFSLSFL